MATQQGRTMPKGSKIKRNRKFGYRSRKASKPGKRVIANRISKGRHNVSNASGETGSRVQKNKRISRRR